MTDELFTEPVITAEQASYDAAVQSINSSLKTIVQAALDFDWHESQSDFCFQKIAGLGNNALSFDRNLSTTTQRIFGIRYLTAEANFDADALNVTIADNAQSGPRIASQILSRHHVKCAFQFAALRDLSEGEMVCEELEGRLMRVEILLFDETLKQLNELKATAKIAADEVLQILTMCKFTYDFTPYYDYLKSWDDEQTS
jgi:hypothetical protein